MNLGKTILELRKKKNVTQDELAAELGVTAAAVSKWENGYTLPDILMLCALADYFQVTTDELLGRSPKPFCAAISTDLLGLLDPVQELLEKHGFTVKYKLFGSYEEALATAKSDPSVTHLFISYADSKREYESGSSDLRVVLSAGETEEIILLGFEFYLKNMTHMDGLAQKKENRYG